MKGKIEGIEFTGNYASKNFSAYANLSFQTAIGRYIESAQFNFASDDLAYIADNYIHLDHEQRVNASAGASYLWDGTRLSRRHAVRQRPAGGCDRAGRQRHPQRRLTCPPTRRSIWA